MDYTQSDSFDTDAGNGQRFHEDGKAVPTIWSAKDANSIIWSLMELLKAAELEGKQFNRADPGTYTLLRDAVNEMIRKQTEGIGGLPRFTPYVWGGQAAAMPEGDTQSSGQQLTDLMYPTMRAQVTATQFICTEAVWQADPYKRITHWSLGDGAAWMRPPDKNGVQPGNVGAFYGSGSNPAGGKTGTAVIDAMRNIAGSVSSDPGAAYQFLGEGSLSTSGPFSVKFRSANAFPDATGAANQVASLHFDAAAALPPGTTTDPITGEFRPRTWYGIWLIRMYGRVVNPGALNAAALNARLDLIDARVASLEGIPKPLGVGQTWQNVTASRAFNITYTNTTGRSIFVQVSQQSSTTFFNGVVDGVAIMSVREDSTSDNPVGFLVPPGSTYRVDTSSGTLLTWFELR